MRKVVNLIRVNFPFVVILIFSILTRFYIFDYPLVAEETNRDFLIARHIAKYQEFASLGPRNGTLPSFGNSPSYYYFLAGLFAVLDNVMFVSFINVLMQITTIVLLYLIIKKIFGMETAIISSLFFGFSKIFVTPAVWPWQPYLMYFFVVCAYYFLFRAYEKEKLIFITPALFFLAYALSLHMSAFAIAPAFLATVYLLIKRANGSWRAHFLTYFAFVVTTILLFAPTILYARHENQNAFFSLWEIIAKNSKEFFINFQERVLLILKTLPVLPLAVFPFSLLYLKSPKKNKAKGVYLLLLFWFTSFLFFFSLFDGNFFDQHLYPVYPVIVVIAAETINRLLPARTLFAPIKYALVVVLIIFLARGATEKASLFPFTRYKSAKQITGNLATEIRRVARDETYENLNFFQFRIYSPEINFWWGGNIDIIDSIYWVLLETEMDYKFTRLKDSSSSNYFLLNSDDYLFVNCLDYENDEDEEKECFQNFYRENPGYKIIRRIPGKPSGNSFYIGKKLP